MKLISLAKGSSHRLAPVFKCCSVAISLYQLTSLLRSVMSPQHEFPACDVALDAGAQLISTSGALVLLVNIVGPLYPSIILRQGDKAQKLTLRLLEARGAHESTTLPGSRYRHKAIFRPPLPPYRGILPDMDALSYVISRDSPNKVHFKRNKNISSRTR